ncbi:MAG: hypothetical protein QG602_3459, partial [Verrucomicrobiota bacterium]|nr:hypothetical protein [Verrucomicrobiota bacterium]
KLNELIYTSSLDTAWWSSGAVTRVSSNNTAPDGTPTAILVDDGVATSGHYTYKGGLTGGVAGATYTLSCYIKDSTRRYADLSISAGGGDYGVACFDLQSEVVASTGQSGSGWSVSDSSITAVGNGWYRCEVVVVAGLAPTQVLIACAADATFGTAGPCSYTGTNKQMYFWGAQLERASSAGTYFPVGSVYPYHGACVDGVKYFATENGNTVASNVVTEATGAAITRPENDGLTNGLVLPGVVGNNASAPHIAAYEFGAGSFTCAAWVTLSAVGAYQTICGAGSNTGADFRCMVNGSDGLTLFWGTDAQAYTQSSTIGTVSANTLYHLVWGYNATTGKVFYALNGTFQEIAAANHALSGSAAMRVGDDPTGDPTTGRVYACRLYNSALSSAQISADYAAGKSSVVTTGAVFDADFSSQAIGAGSFTESSSNAATVTVNTSGIPAAYIGNPLRLFNYEGYLAESARTNLVVRSSDFSLIWLAFNGPTLSAAAAYCGEIALALIGDDGAGAVEYYGQNVAFTADASKSVSFLIKQGTSTSSVVRLEDTTATANRLLVAITWSGGVPICTYTTGAAERAPEYMGGGVWRIFCLTTSVTAANNNQLTFFPATTAALAVANTGDVYIGGVQAENATTASASHIPTTTATVTRNLDYLVYPAAGNVSDTGALYAEAGLTPVATSREIVGLAGFGSGLYLTGAVGASSLNLYDGTNNLGAANTASVLSDMRKAAGSWSGVTQSVCFEGGAVATGPYDGSMNIEYIYAGQCGTALLMNGLVRNIRVATTRVSDADLQLITA